MCFRSSCLADTVNDPAANKAAQQQSRQTWTTGIETCITTPDQILRAQLCGICMFALFKSIKLVRTSLWAWAKQQTSLRKKTATEVKTGEGRAKLTADSLSDLLMGYQRKRWSMRERDSHSEGERDRHTHQLYLCKLIFTWSDWLVSYASICHEASLTLSHTRLKHCTQTAHHTHPQIIYLLFCHFGGLLALGTLWRLLEMQQEIQTFTMRANCAQGFRLWN